MDYLTASPRERNKRWPFLRINRNSCWDDELEKGWRIAFGEMMWDEIKDVLVKNHELDTMRIMEIKEKFAALRIYFDCGEKSFEKVDRIIYKYSTLSENICIVCGKPDVPQILEGWIDPYCKDCFSKMRLTADWTQEKIDKYYAEKFSNNSTMSDFARWSSMSHGKEVEHALWIKDTADKIRANYNAKA